jgi:Rrf2 family transcriptional regulator, iron-sulfur cluster assembly transcription factor
MKLSTRARYGLRAMTDLAMRDDGAPVMMRSIAANEDLSKRYLDNIFATLRQEGLVRSIRGAAGGYRLARPADQIHVDEIVAALEGEILLVHCDHEFDGCDKQGRCATSEIWQQASDALRSTFSAVSLADLAERQASLEIKAGLEPRA